MKYTYNYPMFSVVVDIIVQRGDGKILLITRKDSPFKDCLALPGGYVNINENIVDAATRELQEETGISLSRGELDFLGVFDKPDRDPRGRVISHVYYIRSRDKYLEAKANDDAKELGWFSMDELEDIPLAFDHSDILDCF